MNYDITNQLLIVHSAFVKYLRKNENTMKQCTRYLDFKKAHDPVSMTGSCIILSLDLASP